MTDDATEMPRCFSISIQSGRRMARGLARLHAAGDLNRSCEQQQFFRSASFTGVRVGNDGEGASPRDTTWGMFMAGGLY